MHDQDPTDAVTTHDAAPEQRDSSPSARNAGETPDSLKRAANYTVEDLFFSVTDLQSYILYGNDAFFRVAEYSPSELIGRPHNTIRNPAMPKAVFKLLWGYLQSGKGLGAYVVNQTKTGRYYWVFGLFSPVIDAETNKPFAYISVRLKPQSTRLATIAQLYQEMIDIEQNDSVDASYDYLMQSIKDLGFEGYDDFIQDSMGLESNEFINMAFFEKLLQRDRFRKHQKDDLFASLKLLRQGITVFDRGLKALFDVKSALLEIRELLEGTRDFFSIVRDSSMNLAISSAKLKGSSSRVLRPIVSQLIEMAETGENMMEGFERMANNLLRNHKSLAFDASKILFYSSAYHDDLMGKAFAQNNDNDTNSDDSNSVVEEAISNVTLQDLQQLASTVQLYVSDIQTLSDLVIRKLGYILTLGRALATQGSVLAEGWNASGVLNTLSDLQKDIYSIESQLDNTAKNFNDVLNTMSILTDATKTNVAAFEQFSSGW